MKRKILIFVLSAIVALSMPTALFAAEVESAEPVAAETISSDVGITPMSTTTTNVGVSRNSKTSGSVSAYGSFNVKATKATCTITLQEKYNGSWRTATNIPVVSYVKTEYNVYSIAASRTFTLNSGKVYRAKVVFTDTNSSGTSIKTVYSGSF